MTKLWKPKTTEQEVVIKLRKFYYQDGSVAMMFVAAFLLLREENRKDKEMRNIRKRLLACVLAVTMCVCTINVPVQAEVSNNLEQISTDIVESEEVVESEEGSSTAESGEVVESEEGSSVAENEEVIESEEGSSVAESEEVVESEEGSSTAESEEVVESEEGSSVAESEEVIESEEGSSVAENEEVVESETEITIVEEMTSWDGHTTEAVFEENDYRILFTLSSYWSGGYNASIKIENTSDTAIENWYLNLDYDSEIINIWNAEIYEKTQNGYIIKNAGWNQDISAGSFVEFGISGNESFKGFPKKYEIQGSSSEAKTEDYTVSYKLQSDWGNGFVASVSVTNNTDKTLEDWILEFDFDRQISQIWNSEILSHEGNHYVIKNAGYNANIVAGATVNFGFQGGASAQMQEPESYKLHSYNADKSIGETDDKKDTDNDKVNIFFETNGGSEIASQEVNYGEVPEFPEFPVKENTSFVGWYFDENLENIYNFESPITEDTILYAKWDEDVFTWDSRIDTDNDGLPDGYEILYDITDSKKEETTEGILDADVDFDQDNFTMLEEYQNDTDPINPDTDGDGLLDGDECKIYSTNPLVADTDGDGLLDGDELLAGLDPLNPSTFGYSDVEYLVELEVEENSDLVSSFNNNNSEYQVSLKVKGSADVNSAIKIKNSKAYDSLKSDLILGNAVEIKMDKCNKIDNLNISIRIMENNINDKYSNEELKGIKRYNIFFFDEANQILIPIETSFDESNNIICSQITKSGTYCVVDMERWLSELGFESFDTTKADVEEISLLCDDELFFESVDLISAASGMNLYALDSETLEDEVALMNELTDIEEIYDVTNTLDLVFCINNNVEGLTNTEFQSIVNNLLVLGETAFSKTKDVHIYVIDQHGVPVSTPFGQKYATNKNEITLMINQLANSSPKEQYIDKQINSMIDDLGLRVSANKIAIFFGNSYLSGNSYNLIPRVKEANIHCVIVCPATQPGSWYDTLKKETDGLLVYSYSDFLEPTLEYIYGYVPNIPHSSYNIILSNTLKIVMLDDEIKFNGKTDTDGDSLTDWNEIEQEKISVNADNTLSLLTYKEYLSKYCFSYNLFLSNFAKIINKNGKSLDDFLNTIYVLPVKTDPSKADTDNDGVNDNLDPYPLKNHSFATLDEYLTTDTWGSKYFNPDADDLEYVSNPRDYYDTIVIHHSNRSQNEKITALEKHETLFNSNHFNGVPYHFVINGSGTIYQGRSINYMGAHVAKNNTGKIGVCLMGNFQSDNNGIKQIIKSALPTTPTDSQYEAMEELIKVLETQYDTQYSGGHKDFVVNGNTTVCPGNNCYTMLQDDGYIKLP